MLKLKRAWDQTNGACPSRGSDLMLSLQRDTNLTHDDVAQWFGQRRFKQRHAMHTQHGVPHGVHVLRGTTCTMHCEAPVPPPPTPYPGTIGASPLSIVWQRSSEHGSFACVTTSRAGCRIAAIAIYT